MTGYETDAPVSSLSSILICKHQQGSQGRSKTYNLTTIHPCVQGKATLERDCTPLMGSRVGASHKDLWRPPHTFLVEFQFGPSPWHGEMHTPTDTLTSYVDVNTTHVTGRGRGGMEGRSVTRPHIQAKQGRGGTQCKLPATSWSFQHPSRQWPWMAVSVYRLSGREWGDNGWLGMDSNYCSTPEITLTGRRHSKEGMTSEGSSSASFVISARSVPGSKWYIFDWTWNLVHTARWVLLSTTHETFMIGIISEWDLACQVFETPALHHQHPPKDSQCSALTVVLWRWWCLRSPLYWCSTVVRFSVWKHCSR